MVIIKKGWSLSVPCVVPISGLLWAAWDVSSTGLTVSGYKWLDVWERGGVRHSDGLQCLSGGSGLGSIWACGLDLSRVFMGSVGVCSIVEGSTSG